MVDFFVKSILSLGILYVFYLLFLSRLKTFRFNRYFLLGSLIFSLLIPLISIPVNDTALPIIQSAGKVSLSSAIEYSGEFIASKEVEQNAMISYLPYFYAAISLILLLRFSANLFSIAKTIIKNQKIKKAGYSIVLLSNQIIPYSFFRYVLVNEHQYQADTIDEALIQHEITHCRQWHSLDILWVELIKVLFWINPFIWLMKKSVQLNHEFLADDSVLSNHSITNYKNLLINLVFKHNSGILISNFNYSFTKQRLKMMTKQVTPLRAAFGRTASLFLFLLIAMTISCHREIIEPVILSDKQVEWWEPILKVHNIEPAAYNNFSFIY
jgi:bla regulator protein BlaR1